MLDEKMTGVLDQLFNRAIISLRTLMSSLRMGKADFQIQNESDYAIGLAHGIIITGFVSHFNTHNKREPNQEELIEVSRVLSKRTAELREAVFKGE